MMYPGAESTMAAHATQVLQDDGVLSPDQNRKKMASRWDGHDLLLDSYGRRNLDSAALYEVDRDTENRIKKVTEGMSASMHVLANEPSLGMYRMQEHVSKSVPELVQYKKDIQKNTQRIQGACHDVEYALNTIQDMHSITSLASLHAHTVKAVELQQALRQRRIASQGVPPPEPEPEADDHDDVAVEPAGVFSSVIESGATPPPDVPISLGGGAEEATAASPVDPTKDPEVPGSILAVEKADERASDNILGSHGNGDGGDTAAAGAALPDGSAEGDSQQQSKKKKKKRKKKDIVTKSF
eukprot:m.40310 g.40310  ORF g.40310 m.40310 type:complete len:298 (-) comp14801_c0_seq4:61-954(-)